MSKHFYVRKQTSTSSSNEGQGKILCIVFDFGGGGNMILSHQLRAR